MSAQCQHNVRTMSARCPHYVCTTSQEGYMSGLYLSSFFSSELKTEEGYSADICIFLEIYVRTMSAQYPHYVRTTSHKGYMSHKGDVVRTLCRHLADIYLQGYMSAQCLHYILHRFSAQRCNRSEKKNHNILRKKQNI